MGALLMENRNPGGCKECAEIHDGYKDYQCLCSCHTDGVDEDGRINTQQEVR